MRYYNGTQIFGGKDYIPDMNNVIGLKYADDETLAGLGIYPITEPIYDTATHKLGDLVLNGAAYEYTIIPYTTEELVAKKKQEIVNFMNSKKSDGQTYVADIKTDITISLIGLPTADVNTIDKAMIESVEPMLDLIEKGDWWSAVNLELPIPTDATALAMQTQVKAYAQNYVLTNYPTEL